MSKLLLPTILAALAIGAPAVALAETGGAGAQSARPPADYRVTDGPLGLRLIKPDGVVPRNTLGEAGTTMRFHGGVRTTAESAGKGVKRVRVSLVRAKAGGGHHLVSAVDVRPERAWTYTYMDKLGGADKAGDTFLIRYVIDRGAGERRIKRTFPVQIEP